MASMTSYNIHQQVSILSQCAGILWGCTGTQSDLQQKIKSQLPQTIQDMQIGDWVIPWGPTVWKLSPDDTDNGPDHTWYIAHGSSADFGDATLYDVYVVAIAGTGSKSLVNIVEDADVVQVVDFNAWLQSGLDKAPEPGTTIDKTKPYISFGTAFGVHVLLNAKGPDGTTLPQFLATIPSTSRLIFTGHSLGGALSPVLALALLKADLVNNAQNVFTYPTAGPSPGNEPFANLFADTFPKTTVGSKAYQVWNANIWNSLDIVPHAWCISGQAAQDQNLTEIPIIYGVLPDDLSKTIIGCTAIAIGLSNASGITYIPLQGSKFTSTQPPVPQTFDAFLAQAGIEHGAAYREFFGTSEVPPLCAPGDAVDEAKRLPVLQVLYQAEVALEASKAEKAKKKVEYNDLA